MGENLIGVGSGEKRLRGTGDKKQPQVVRYSKPDMDDHQHTGKPRRPALPRLEWNSGCESPDHLSTWPWASGNMSSREHSLCQRRRYSLSRTLNLHISQHPENWCWVGAGKVPG